MKLLTPESVAEQLAVSRSTVLRLIADKSLPAVCLRSGRRKKVWRVREEVLQKWVLQRERQGEKSNTDNNPNALTGNTSKRDDSRPGNGEALD
jgi:excisionase family DNA binding protein